MTPSNVILDRLQILLASDTATLAPAALAVHVHLAKAPFTPNPALTLAGLTEADFPGYAVALAGTGTQQAFLDPNTGLRVIQLLEPAGGWTWASTGTPTPNQVISGFYVTDNANAVLYASALLDQPVTISGSGQGVTVGTVRFSMPPGALI